MLLVKVRVLEMRNSCLSEMQNKEERFKGMKENDPSLDSKERWENTGEKNF